MIFSKGLVPISFTPLAAYPLVQAQVKCITFDDKMYTYFGDGRKMVSVLSKDKDDEDEHVIWLGIAISEETLLSTEALMLCILPEDERLTPFIKDIKVYDTDNHSIHILRISLCLIRKNIIILMISTITMLITI